MDINSFYKIMFNERKVGKIAREMIENPYFQEANLHLLENTCLLFKLAEIDPDFRDCGIELNLKALKKLLLHMPEKAVGVVRRNIDKPELFQSIFYDNALVNMKYFETIDIVNYFVEVCKHEDFCEVYNEMKTQVGISYRKNYNNLDLTNFGEFEDIEQLEKTCREVTKKLIAAKHCFKEAGTIKSKNDEFEYN